MTSLWLEAAEAKERMKPVKTTFAEIVSAICRRPKMYMMHGTFGEALAFLDGYANGRRLGSKGRSASVFSPFRKWLSTKLDLENDENFWPNFIARYGDDQTALNEFARLWAEYEAASENHEQYVI